jgi:hypothetical protein
MSRENRHKAFNKAIVGLRRTARAAADALAVALPDAPLPPALPLLPITWREVRWMGAVLASADEASLPDTEAQRSALRDALAEIAALMRAVPLHPLVRNEIRALHAAVPAMKGDTRPLDECLHHAVASGLLTASQAEAWRFRLGI